MTVKISVTGAAGLVGQNLIPRLKARGYSDIAAIDKHRVNVAILRQLHPDILVIEADLASDDGWQQELEGSEILIVTHAQIGGLDRDAFQRNNIVATRRMLEAAKRGGVSYVVHLSSSVVESAVTDWYTESKKTQEELILDSGLPCIVLRPTLMFGWFDRKHVGWLARFMQRVPVFPIPGQGRFLRQPLYIGDLCDILISCIERRPQGVAYNISGHEKIEFIELMRLVKRESHARAAIIRIPYSLFWALLWVYGLFDRDPPFTTKQLEALVAPDIFEVIDWPRIFGVKATPLPAAIKETFNHPIYSKIVLDF